MTDSDQNLSQSSRPPQPDGSSLDAPVAVSGPVEGTAKAGGRKKSGKARELASSLSGVAALTGAALPAEERMAPRLCVTPPVTPLARALGQLLRSEPLFFRVADREVVTVDPETGEVELMRPLRFITYAEERVTFYKVTEHGERPASLFERQAATILASDIFRNMLRPLRALNLVRMPVWTSDAQKAVRLLQAGYDEPTGTFTVDSVPYATDMDPDEARNLFLERKKQFPFSRPVNEPLQPLEENRSFAVLMAGYFSNYCRLLCFGELRPAIVIQANQKGSGKSLLLRSIIQPVVKKVDVQALPRDENEMGKLLTAAVAGGLQYRCFDNVKGYLNSPELESFITSPRRSGRHLGFSKMLEADNDVAIFITGNGLSLSPDLARRSLLCDLWYAGKVEERVIEDPIDETRLRSVASRSTILSAMWALVDYWSTFGCPRSKGARLAGFEGFSEIIGGIVTTAKFADPMAKPEVNLDQTEEAWLALFRKMADDLPDGGERECTWEDLKDAAEELEILETLLPRKVMDQKTALGKRASKWEGREFTDSYGRPFRFGDRHARIGAKKTFRNLLPPKDEGEDAAPDTSSED